MHGLQEQLQGPPGTLEGLSQLAPPDSRHHSYPSQRPPRASMSDKQVQQKQEISARADGKDMALAVKTEGEWGKVGSEALVEGLMARFQSPHQLAPVPPACMATATVRAAHPTALACNPDLVPSWTARPAPQVSGPAPSLQGSVLKGRQLIPAFAQHYAPMPTWQPTVPHHLSAASFEMVPALASTQAGRMATSGRLWLGSQGG